MLCSYLWPALFQCLCICAITAFDLIFLLSNMDRSYIMRLSCSAYAVNFHQTTFKRKGRGVVTWSRLTNILLSGVAVTVQSLFSSAPSHFMIQYYFFVLKLLFNPMFRFFKWNTLPEEMALMTVLFEIPGSILQNDARCGSKTWLPKAISDIFHLLSCSARCKDKNEFK